MTDATVLILSIFFLIRGASRGFINSLVIPFSILVATIVSIIYYQITKEMIVSLLIGLIGPLLLSLGIRVLLKKLAKATNSEIKPSFFSRLGGAFLTLAWGWIFIIFALILLVSLPTWGKTLTMIHNDVIKSASYFFVKPISEEIFAASKQNAADASSGSSDTPSISSADAKSLAEDPRFIKILQDPEIQKDIDAHDIVKLMSNPKMMDLTRQIMSDPAMMKKVMALYSTQTAPKSYFTESNTLK
jgi:hypothetical protein